MQACAVESAANKHPDRKVVLLHRMPVTNKQKGLNYVTDSCRYEALNEMPNVVLLRLDELEDIFSETPMDTWFQRKAWMESTHMKHERRRLIHRSPGQGLSPHPIQRLELLLGPS
ncbi:uncharacterized protein LOC144161922 [Haemaphysalis longicornis]